MSKEKKLKKRIAHLETELKEARNLQNKNFKEATKSESERIGLEAQKRYLLEMVGYLNELVIEQLIERIKEN